MILAQIHNKYHSLTAAEKKIAAYVLGNPVRVTEMTAKELAGHCGTAQSAVIRFCKSIETEGFSDLKIALARETASTESPASLPAFHKNDNTGLIFEKVFASGIRTLKDTLAMLSFRKVDEIINVLCKARSVSLFGIGTSSTVAIDAGYRFAQFGIQAHAYTDILFMNVVAGNMKPGDVAFAISHGGQTKAVVDAMRRAKATGATTIALTSFADSLIYRESDISLSVYADEENYPVEAVSARVAHICVIDALMMALGTKSPEGLEHHVAIRNQALEELRYRT